MSTQKNQGRIFWGILLIFLGVLFLLDQMNKLDFGDLVGRYWPVIFILIGISILLSNNFKTSGQSSSSLRRVPPDPAEIFDRAVHTVSALAIAAGL
jgi:hypothetical protein